ncbi:MAG: hypothetical protein OEY86_05720 [Nitrospira sp.]|nr:hypothetical protein [Nitrospira sp.]
MARHPTMAWGDRRQNLVVVLLSLGAIGFTGILSYSSTPVFQPFFRNIPPVLAVSVISVLGVVSLGVLSSSGWFEMYSRKEGLRGVVWSSACATLFAVGIVLVDYVIIFPYQHVPPPQSLLFYPAIAYVAEIVFHLLPLSILVTFLDLLFKDRNPTGLVWLCIVLASCIEPIFQLSWRSSESALSWVDAYVGLHVLAFNVLQFALFRRYDFIAMYVCVWPIMPNGIWRGAMHDSMCCRRKDDGLRVVNAEAVGAIHHSRPWILSPPLGFADILSRRYSGHRDSCVHADCRDCVCSTWLEY